MWLFLKQRPALCNKMRHQSKRTGGRSTFLTHLQSKADTFTKQRHAASMWLVVKQIEILFFKGSLSPKRFPQKKLKDSSPQRDKETENIKMGIKNGRKKVMESKVPFQCLTTMQIMEMNLPIHFHDLHKDLFTLCWGTFLINLKTFYYLLIEKINWKFGWRVVTLTKSMTPIWIEWKPKSWLFKSK